MFTVLSPTSPWLGSSQVITLSQAVSRKIAWKVNQNAIAIILDKDGYIVSQLDQDLAIVEVLQASY